MSNRVYYDLHIHSCLSPCGDNDMTPGNIAGMAMLKGLNLVAVTDHNSTLNCPAFFEFATELGLIAIAGAEVTTAEDIHVLTLFESLEGAMDFNSLLEKRRFNVVKNNPNIFGNQFVVNAKDDVIRDEETLLINSVDISVDDIYKEVKKYSGVAIPAHIDKESNGIVSVLGTIPDCGFSTFEIFDRNKKDEFLNRFSVLNNARFVSNSDAHYLWDINEKVNHFDILSDLTDVKSVIKELFTYLRG